ncbi:MAG: hypothetical protein R3E08_12675, partial [Thiotrichaceae bacterium]
LGDWSGKNGSNSKIYFNSVPGDAYFDNIKLTDTTISIKGKVYYDKNCNGRLDPIETGIPGAKLVIDSTKSSTHASDLYPDPITDGNGIYDLKGYDALNNYFIYINQPLSQICANCATPTMGSGLSQSTKLTTYSLVGDTTHNIGIKPVASECQTSQMAVLPIQTDVGENKEIEVAFSDATQNVNEYTLVLEVDGNRMIKTFTPVGTASVQPIVDTTSTDTLIPTLGTDGLVHVKIPFTFDKGGNIAVKAQLSSNQGVVGEETTTAIVRATAISDSCAPGVATISSLISGDYNNPKTWGGKLPTPNDWVLVRNGHSVTLPTVSKAMRSDKIRFKGLCVEKGAKIYTKSYRTLNMMPPSLIKPLQKWSRWRTCTLTEPYVKADNCQSVNGAKRNLKDVKDWGTIVGTLPEPPNPFGVWIPADCTIEASLVDSKAATLILVFSILFRQREQHLLPHLQLRLPLNIFPCGSKERHELKVILLRQRYYRSWYRYYSEYTKLHQRVGKIQAGSGGERSKWWSYHPF